MSVVVERRRLRALLVRVVDRGIAVGAGLYVNSQLVSSELGGVLAKEVKVRPPDWPVYAKGDQDLDWKSVAGSHR